MTRIGYIIAAAFLAAAVHVPAAEACVSCNYTPEVVNTPTKSAPAKPYKKPAVQQRRPDAEHKRAVRVEKEPRQERKTRDAGDREVARRTKPETDGADDKDNTAAKQTAPDDTVDTAKSTGTEKTDTGAGEVRTWTSTTGPIGGQPSTGAKSSDDSKPAAVTPAEDKSESTTATAAAAPATAAAAEVQDAGTAETDTAKTTDDAPHNGDEVGCKKYNAAARVTITVPCE